jgi:hypothetical protein
MTQPYDHRPDDATPDAWPGDDMPDAADTVDATESDEHQPEAVAPPATQPEPGPRPEPQSFGDERVDRAVERLSELDERAVGDHVEVFDDIHGRLRDALEEAAVDTSPQ